MGLRDRIVSLVPGIKNTTFGKKTQIDNCVKDYSELLEQRTSIDTQIEQVEQALGLTAKNYRNLDELAAETDRLTTLRSNLTSIYSKGQTDPTQLTEDELLTFQRLKELENLNKSNYLITAKILAIRQGLMNISDRENSTINGELENKYKSPAEFIDHSNSIRLMDFLNACRRTGLIDLPALTQETVTDLVVSNGISPQSQSLVQASPILKTFVEKLSETNARTGYTSGTYPVVPFDFKEGRLDGEIIIALSEAKELPKTDRTMND